MSANPQQPDLRNKIWLGGRGVRRDPVPVTVSLKPFEAQTRMADGSLRVDRLLLEGYPNKFNRFQLGLTFNTVREAPQLELIDSLLALGQPFDVCLFKQAYDFFDGDGATKEFVIQRRIAQPIVQSAIGVTWYPDYATQLYRYAGPYGDPASAETVLTVTIKTSATMDTGTPGANDAWVEQEGHADGNKLVTRVRLGTAPVANADVLKAVYLPYMRMVIESDAGRTYDRGLQESRSFKLTEQ